MALTAWTGRNASQVDADSPVDEPLMQGFNADMTHLRQVLYGNGSGGFNTPIDGHVHNGSDSEEIVLGTDSVGATQIIDGSVGAAELDKTGTNGSQAINGSSSFTPPAGFYLFYALGSDTFNINFNDGSIRNILRLDGAANHRGAYMWCDGSNLTVFNLSGSSKTIHFSRRD